MPLFSLMSRSHTGVQPQQAGSEHADNNDLYGLSGRVIGCAFTVLNTLGAWFLEKVYENALAYEVRAASLSAGQQYGAREHYNDILVGEYFVDLLINDMLLVELRTVKALNNAHTPPGLSRGSNAMHQLSEATGLQLYLLLDFWQRRRPTIIASASSPGLTR